MVSNLFELEETLEDSILELQDFGDSLYDKSTEGRSKADRLFEIEKKLVFCQGFAERLRDHLVKFPYRHGVAGQTADKIILKEED